jgi:ubiquinone/menaquinone biosynthesis C-methylase UbiE
MYSWFAFSCLTLANARRYLTFGDLKIMDLKGTGRRLLWKYWYPYLTRLTQDASVNFLNYGYVNGRSIDLQPADETNRLYIQLYHHVAGAVDLTDMDVMEVSCGHGGGASYVARYLQPKTMLGVDRNPNAIKFCRNHHTVRNLSFVQGDAEALQFDDHSFDAIINVEASHCYGNMSQFLKEITRLLRPGGYFLSADFRTQAGYTILSHQLIQSGLEIIKKENITPNVLRAMAIDDQAKLQLIQQLAPRILHKPVAQFAGVKGSNIFNGFESGTMIYLSYVLRNPNKSA